MYYKKFMKNAKAISPIFATLILIAISVIAGVVVYMFTSGTLATMTSGGTAGQEKVTVQASGYTVVNSTGATVTLYIVQTAGPAATVNGLIIKDSNGNTVATAIPGTSGSLTLTTGTLTTITGSILILPVNSGSYTVTVTTKAGGSFISPPFTV